VWPETILQRAQDWLRTFDPGKQHLRTASRTTLTVGFALLVLFLLAQATHQPVTVVLVGVDISLNCAMAINDPDPRQRSITYLLAPLTAAGALTLGVLLVQDQVLSDVVFVAIMFIATAARRFGTRGTALGLLAFWTYFLAILLHAALAQVPWFLLATVVGAACAFLLGTWLLPDQPERLLGGLRSVLDVRVAVILDRLRATLAAGQITPSARARLISSVAQLHSAALALEEQADRVDPGTVWSGVTPDQLTQAVVTVEMAAGQMVNRYWQFAVIAEHVCNSGDPTLLAARDRVSEAMRQLAMATTGLEALTSGHVPRVQDALDRVLPWSDGAATGDPRPVPQEATPPVVSTGRVGPAAPFLFQLHPETRQAIQVAVATSAAIFAGELLSPARWYWAVLTAFLVYVAATSAAQTLTRSWYRVLGTVLGIPVGILIGTAVGSNLVISLVFIFVCIFCLVYFLGTPAWVMTFWITILVAMFYALLGKFSAGTLILRLEETAVGAAIGILTAFLVLPASTRATVTSDIRRFLAALGAFLEQGIRPLMGEPAVVDPLAATRALDRQLWQVRTDAQAFSSSVRSQSGILNIVRLLYACAFRARSLAHVAGGVEPGPSVAGRIEIARAVERLRANLDVVCDQLSPDPLGHHQVGALQSATDLLDEAEEAAGGGEEAAGGGEEAAGGGEGWAVATPSPTSTDVPAVIRELRTMDYLILRLGDALGADVRAGDLAPPARAS
jgi:uncharacterized membrane protein YccC